MKIRTNLSNEELEFIGYKLQSVSKGSKKIKLENSAEEELLRKSNHCFDVFLDNLQDELSKLLLK